MKRRSFVSGGTLVLLLGAHELAAGATILAVRIWPAPDYTRVTIESDAAVTAKSVVVINPPRLALDIDGIELNPALRELVAKLKSDDPHIAGIRVGNGAERGVRLVIDLKQAALPQVFSLPPVAAYQHRLVVDFYPTKKIDPLESLIAERLKEGGGGAPAVAGSLPGGGPATPAAASRMDTPSLGAATGAYGASGASPSAAASTGGALSPAMPPGSGAADPLGELIARQTQRPQAPRAVSTAPLGPPAVQSPSSPSLASAASVARPVPLSRTDRLIIVALDPGHGGEDPGAVGPSGTREKDVVLAIAHRLRERINATTVKGNPMRAYMTRDADFFVPLHVRVQKAQRVQADLFVSIHADAFLEPHARGASVFALSRSGASSAAARWLANKENNADVVGGVDVRTQDQHVVRALIDMSTTAQINDSLKLGSALLGEIGSVGRLHKPKVEQAGFAVLKAPDIPSVLVETAFISNPDEESKLRSDAYQDQLADALMRGIERYFAKNPPLARNRTL